MPEIIESQQKLTSLMEELCPQPRLCAIDTEADSLHRYKESLCLIQLSAGGRNVLIDPLALNDLSSFDAYLNSCEVWMHGADYDMTMLKRQFGILPPKVWDTQIGARLLGLRKFGLSDLVEHWFGVVLCKTSQKADWGRRPMTDKMMEYAINDVVFLLPMAECIVEELIDKGRYEWFVQSCEAARKKVLERDENKEDLWRINGSGRLSPQGLAYLQALWNWRNAEAASWDKPTFMVVNNKEMLAWAEMLSQGNEISLPKHLLRPERLKRFEKAVHPVRDMVEEQWPEKIKALRRKKDAAFDRAVDEIIKKRDAAAVALDIDPSLLIARSIAECLAAGELAAEDCLLPWQIEQLKL